MTQPITHFDMKEIWKDITGYEGIYQISNFGRVKSFDKQVCSGYGLRIRQGRIMKLEVNRIGYLAIKLTDNKGKIKYHLIHRLVALAFIPNPENKRTVNHKDGNKTNNHVDNLEWFTQSEQNFHRYRVLKYPATMLGKSTSAWQKRGIENPRSRPVICIDTGKVYGSISEAQKELNVNNIWPVCNGKCNHTGGLRFKYA